MSGILVKRNFNYHILDPKDLSKYTDLTMSTVTQRQSIHYGGSLAMLQHILQQTAGEVETVAAETENKKIIRAFGSIDIIWEPRMVTLEWIASPCNDMFADAVLSTILQAEAVDNPKYFPSVSVMDDVHFKECLIELLQDMFGEESVPKVLAGDTITVTVDNKDAFVSLNTMRVTCEEDPTFEKIVQTAVSKLRQSLIPLHGVT